MYEELVKKLRYCGNAVSCLHCPYWEGCEGSKEDLIKAADAIEELICEVADEHNARLDAADAIEELRKAVLRLEDESGIYDELPTFYIYPAKWIPVEERLPLLNTPVLATDGIEVDISWMYGVPPKWITSYTAIDEDKLTHWMPLPQTPKEEK